jgi:gas vesicle protein
MDTKKLVLGVLAGFAAGAALGVLFAPDKGSETRKKIVNKGGSLADDLSDTLDDKFNKLADTIMGKVKARKQEQPETNGATRV